MKVTGVRTLIVDNYRTNWVIVALTLEDGTTGVGESTLIGTEQAVASLIGTWTEQIVGTDVLDVGAWHARMRRDNYWLTGPVVSAALSAVDIAMWDAKGKVLGVPVSTLLGGRFRDRQLAYANGWYVGATTPQGFAEKARAIVDRGFKALKWDPFGKSATVMRRPELLAALRCVSAVRDAVGDEVQILIEGHGRFDVPTAIDAGRALADFSIGWFEEPIPPGRPEQLAEVRRSVPVPIAAGERCYSLYDVAVLLHLEAVDIVQADVTHLGGLTEMQSVDGLVRSTSRSSAPHNANGPIGNAATMHLALALEAVSIVETFVTDVPWRKDIFAESVRLEDGYLTLDPQPGLGVEVNLEQAANHPYQPHRLRHYSGALTDIRPSDAADWTRA